VSIHWDPRLAIGVAAIDGQHQELFRRAAALIDAMQNAHGKDEVARLLPYLESYVVEHFAAEERLMTSHMYPRMAEHVAQHRKFVEDFVALKAELAKSGATTSLTVRTTTFIGGWLRAHIAKTDQALGTFLNSRTSANL